jgi:hypothetical protein
VVNCANARWHIIDATVSDTCPPKRINSSSIWCFEAPVAAIIWLRVVAKLYRKIAAIRVLAIASFTVPQSSL